MPPGLRDRDQFITPAGLTRSLARRHLHQHDLTGMSPGISPPALIRLPRQVKKGKLSYADFGRQAAFTLTRDLRISYLGHATTNSPHPPARPASAPARQASAAAPEGLTAVPGFPSASGQDPVP